MNGDEQDQRRSPLGRELPAHGAARGEWDLDPGVVFLNHGSFGACPRNILARQRALREQMEKEPVRFFVEELEGLLDQSREVLARLLGASADGLGFVGNATTGVNTIVKSLRFHSGDELLTNTHEYNACNNALSWAAEQWGARVVRVSTPFPIRTDDEIVESMIAGATARTRLALVSHVTSPTGVIFPIRRIVAELQARGVDVLVDAAHAPGMVEMDVDGVGAAYTTGNLHKWMCAPKGCAFVHVREDRRHLIRPLVISHGANAPASDRSRFRQEFDYTGTADMSATLCMAACVEQISGVEGVKANDWARQREAIRAHMARNREDALAGRKVLCRVLGIEPASIMPEHMVGSMAAVPIPVPRGGAQLSRRGYHDDLQDRLIERHAIQVPVMPFPPGPRGPASQRLVRISMQKYNTLGEVEYLAECLREELDIESRGA